MRTQIVNPCRPYLVKQDHNIGEIFHPKRDVGVVKDFLVALAAIVGFLLNRRRMLQLHVLPHECPQDVVTSHKHKHLDFYSEDFVEMCAKSYRFSSSLPDVRTKVADIIHQAWGLAIPIVFIGIRISAYDGRDIPASVSCLRRNPQRRDPHRHILPSCSSGKKARLNLRPDLFRRRRTDKLLRELGCASR
jgi:hypothetical protein